MAFARWDPFGDLLAIQQRLDRFAPGQEGWKPPVDLSETADHYVICAEVPGIRREDLDIQAGEGQVTIAGIRRERATGLEQYHRVERGHGSFSRTFKLPVSIVPDRITADLRDGVLTVTCPKSPEGGNRRIQVS